MVSEMTNNSIIEDVKKTIGIDKDNTAFDTTIVAGINAAFGVLGQIGYSEDYTVSSYYDVWGDYTDNTKALSFIVPYVSLKTRMLFDPPSGSAKDAYDNLMNEYLFRLEDITL